MAKRILVPLDGSPLAEHALAVSAILARASGGMLILVQALAASAEYGSPVIPQVAPLAIVESERRAQDYLTRLTELPILSGLTVETCVLAQVPAQAILDAAADHRADMIVMTSHGRTGFSHWIFGSVAEHVVRDAHIPVLILRQHQLPFWTEVAELLDVPATPGTGVPFPNFRVLVPLDGSPLAETVLEPAASCTLSLVQGVEQAVRAPRGSTGCLIHLVLVVRPIDTLAENRPEALLVSGAERYLSHISGRLGAAHPDTRVSWEVDSGGDVAESIAALLSGAEPTAKLELQRVAGDTSVASANDSYTLLAMATHGRTGLKRWVWGSTTERVLQKTQLPLLLVRPADITTLE